MADALKKEDDVQVEVLDGNRGEFSVLVEGRPVAGKGDSLPDIGEILNAVREAQPAAAR